MDKEIEINWHYDINNWDSYIAYLNSEESKEIVRPEKLKYNEWNPIGHDEDE